MAQRPGDGSDQSGLGHRESEGMPRWVKVFGIVTGVVVLLLLAAMLIAGGQHGPRRHIPGGHTGSLAPRGEGSGSRPA